MHNPKLRHRLHRVTAPVLFVRGEQDGLVSQSYLEGYARLFAKSYTASIQKAGHAPHLEQPDDFAAKVFAFFDS